MNILIITPRIPYPPYRGDKLKIYNIAKNLVNLGNSVTILTFHANNKDDIDSINKLTELGIEVDCVKLTPLESVFNLFKGFFKNLPFQVLYYSSAKMRMLIKTRLANVNYDVIYFHLIRSAQYHTLVQRNNKTVKVLDFTDAVSLYLSRYHKILTNPFRKIAVNIELSRINHYESIASKFDKVYVCSVIDRKHLLEKQAAKNIGIMENGIDLEYFKYSEVKPEKHRIIFTGNMPYFANYDAAIFFAQEVFPLILKKYPAAKFYIVGQNPPPQVRKLQSSSVIVTGFVKDIRHEYMISEVNVAPIRFGAGTLNKILESLVLKVPVVATDMAVAGLSEDVRKYISVANTPSDFADKVMSIFEKRKSLQPQLEEARRLVTEKHNWQNIIAKFEGELKKLVNGSTNQK